ncbi:MAG: hypothetical protein QM484_01040 [Woeseiaceae bacterium]
MRHDNLHINGVEYKFNHLMPLDLSINLEAHNKNSELTVSLTFFFSNHCYTEGVKENEDISEQFLLLDHNQNQRKFCINRYQMSLQLPELLKQLHTKKCFFTGRQNWLVIEVLNNSGENIFYHVFFNIKKHKRKKNGLFIEIQSAYIKEKGENTPTRRKNERMSFAMIARKIITGKPIKSPHSRR